MQLATATASTARLGALRGQRIAPKTLRRSRVQRVQVRAAASAASPATALAINVLAQKATMLGTVVLAFKMYSSNMAFGIARYKRGHRAPEDAKFAPGKLPKQSLSEPTNDDKEVKETAERWGRIVANDLENIPIGLLALWGSALCTQHGAVHAACVAIFCLGRVLHTVFYACKLEKGRALSFLLSNVAVLVAAWLGTRGAFLLA